MPLISLEHSCQRLVLDPQGLALHADSDAKASPMLATLQRFSLVPSFSRPWFTDENAYSETLFRTLKYSPEHPSLPFAFLEQAHAWVDGFICWYNKTEHQHSALRFVTLDDRHGRRERAILEYRQRLHEAIRRQHPERRPGRPRGNCNCPTWGLS